MLQERNAPSLSFMSYSVQRCDMFRWKGTFSQHRKKGKGKEEEDQPILRPSEREETKRDHSDRLFSALRSLHWLLTNRAELRNKKKEEQGLTVCLEFFIRDQGISGIEMWYWGLKSHHWVSRRGRSECSRWSEGRQKTKLEKGLDDFKFFRLRNFLGSV